MWYQIISELFVNIAAAWFGAAFIETQINIPDTGKDILSLIFRFLTGILSLFIAKYFREKVRRKK